MCCDPIKRDIKQLQNLTERHCRRRLFLCYVQCVVWRFRGSSVLRNHVAFHVERTFVRFLDFPRDSVALSNRFGRYHMNSRDLCLSLVASLLADTTIV